CSWTPLICATLCLYLCTSSFPSLLSSFVHISLVFFSFSFFFFNDTATTEIYTLSLHDALPISRTPCVPLPRCPAARSRTRGQARSEEHTSELQSLTNLVCRLLLEKKKKKTRNSKSKISDTAHTTWSTYNVRVSAVTASRAHTLH